MKIYRVFALGILVAMFENCADATPKMACNEQVDVYADICASTLYMNARSGSSYSETLALLYCSLYVKEKEDCSNELY